jgi:hypothetical protein
VPSPPRVSPRRAFAWIAENSLQWFEQAKLPELLRQRPNARVLSAFLLTRRDTFVHTHNLTEDAVGAPVLAPIFARLRGKGRNRSA